MTATFTSGSVTVSLDGALDAFVRDVLARTEGVIVKEMRAKAEDVAATARSRWYGPAGVKRVTGRSGDVQVVEKVDIDKGEIRISIGSTDTRLAVNGRPLPVYIHRPGRFATDLVVCSTREWYGAPKSMRGPWLETLPTKTPQIFRPSEAASDGKFLLQEFVGKPGRALVKEMATRLAAQITGAVSG